jgi:hypothetical protein
LHFLGSPLLQGLREIEMSSMNISKNESHAHFSVIFDQKSGGHDKKTIVMEN